MRFSYIPAFSPLSVSRKFVVIFLFFLRISYEPSAYSGTNYVVDAAVRLLTLTMSTNIAVLHATNRPGSSTTYKETQLRIVGGSTNWNVVWPTGWRRLGSNITQIPSNKLVWVAIVTQTNETDTVFGIAKEE
jgi:hypothetical protein